MRVQKKQSIEAIELLSQLSVVSASNIPKIKYIEESSVKEFLISHSKKWAEAGRQSDLTWWGYQDHTLLEEYPEWPDYFWGNFSRKIVVKLFTNQAHVESDMKEKSYAASRFIKLLPDGMSITTTQVVIGDYIVMINTREKPHYLIEIHDVEMAKNLREFFKVMWAIVGQELGMK